MPTSYIPTATFKLSVCATLLCFAAASTSAIAQSRTCILDENNGQLRCGWLADEQGFRLPDRVAPSYPSSAAPTYPTTNSPNYPAINALPSVQIAPIVVPLAPNYVNERAQREQQRMQAQEVVNALFLEVLGRDADITTLRRVADQLLAGRATADVRIELATSSEARTAINQIYRDILRREADPSGLNAQMAALRGGMSLAQIRKAIADSPEGRARR
jgi:hypothetical protein